jgi:hypothetical protein
MVSLRPPFEITDHADGRTYVHTRVELLYRQFLEKLDRDYQDEEALFEAHIQAIIWGVLYVEGLLNHKLLAFTEKKLARSDLVDGYWNLVKQAKLQDKFDLVFATDRVKRPWLAAAKKNLMKMVEERNRLVHLKEQPTPMDLKSLVEKIGPNAPASAWLEHAPRPKLVSDLLSISLPSRLKLIRDIGDGIERVPT